MSADTNVAPASEQAEVWQYSLVTRSTAARATPLVTLLRQVRVTLPSVGYHAIQDRRLPVEQGGVEFIGGPGHLDPRWGLLTGPGNQAGHHPAAVMTASERGSIHMQLLQVGQAFVNGLETAAHLPLDDSLLESSFQSQREIQVGSRDDVQLNHRGGPSRVAMGWAVVCLTR
ncbi:MAG TPA: hypothetical protein VNG12_17480 [Acidimicrobiales bacterium]|nr:hypothetical protein [Acidimicrobiales bacterium]